MPIVETAGATIHYTRQGTGPALLLVQGVGAVGGAWQPQIDALSERFTVVTYDNRGIGRSVMDAPHLSVEAMADDGLAVMDAEGVGEFHLAGHSMGGVIAQQVALSAPGRVRTLSLLCTFARGAQGARMSWDLLVAGVRSRLGPRAMRRRAFIELIMPPAYLAATDYQRLCVQLERLFERDLALQPPIVMRQLRAMAKYDALTRLSRLGDIPTLVVAAQLDRIALPDFGRQLAAAIPDARLSSCPAPDMPPRFNALMS